MMVITIVIIGGGTSVLKSNVNNNLNGIEEYFSYNFGEGQLESTDFSEVSFRIFHLKFTNKFVTELRKKNSNIIFS